MSKQGHVVTKWEVDEGVKKWEVDKDKGGSACKIMPNNEIGF